MTAEFNRLRRKFIEKVGMAGSGANRFGGFGRRGSATRAA